MLKEVSHQRSRIALKNREAGNVKRRSIAELRPCLGKGSSLGEEAVSADSGLEGEVVAEIGWVKRLDFLSFLQECSPVVPHGRTIEVFLCQHSCFAAC